MWFVSMILMWGLNYQIVKEMESTFSFLKILSIIISIGMIIITILSLSRKTNDKVEYGIYGLELVFLIALGEVICLWKYVKYYSDKIAVTSKLIVVCIFIATVVAYWYRNTIRHWNVVIGILVGIYCLYIIILLIARRVLHYGIITDSLTSGEVQRIFYYIAMPMIVTLEIIGTYGVLRRITVTRESIKRKRD